MNTPQLHTQAAAFVAYLQRYQKDRGALANLRGALSEARRPNAWPLLGGFGGAIGHRAFETVAALWAYAPDQSCIDGNLGDTLRNMKNDFNSFEGRFKRLLTCDQTELVERVAPVVRAAQVKGQRINYLQLLSDLLWWGDTVKIAWARAFWGSSKPDGGLNPALIDADESVVAVEE